MSKFRRLLSLFLLAIIIFGTLIEPLSVFAENLNGRDSGSDTGPGPASSPTSNPNSPQGPTVTVPITDAELKRMMEEYKKGLRPKPIPADEEPKSMPDPVKKGDYYPIPMDKTGRLYGNPKDLMPKTDFIMNIMKVEKVIPGRMLLNRNEYTILTNEGQYKTILTEPVETSPYQEYMGTMGIDTGQTDVIISHQIFGKIDFMSNSNVPELYLVEAYQKGLFVLT